MVRGPRILRLLFSRGFLPPNPNERKPMTGIFARLEEMWAKAQVVLTAAVTWLVIVAAVITVIADELAKVLPSPWSDRLSAWAITILGVLGAIIAIIRRVTPVEPAERGLLPSR